MTTQDITPEDSIVPVFLEPLSAEEIESRKQSANALNSAHSQREAKLESAIKKLEALGLTAEEARLLLG